MKDYLLYTKVAPENVEKAWVHAIPWLQKAMLETNDLHRELSWMKKQLEAGALQLWAIQDKRQDQKPICFLVTEIHDIEGFKILVIKWCAGEKMFEWLEDLAVMEKWALEHGIHKVEIMGRKGWEKTLKSLGYSFEFITVSKLLTRGLN